MAAATSFALSDTSQKAFLQYYQQVIAHQSSTQDNQRARFKEVDVAYQREEDQSQEHKRAQAANKAGDTSRIQNMTVPVVMPQVEAAVTYQTSVFLTGVPIFGVVAAPEFMDAALQLETKIDHDAVEGGWTKELILHFRDGAKYNYAPIEVDWERRVTASLETDISFSSSEGKPVETIWSGNALTRLDPYNTFADPRVPPSEIYKSAEYAGHTAYKSKIQLKQFIAELPDKIIGNITKAFESGKQGNPATQEAGQGRYYVPNINPDIDMQSKYDTSMNWLSWASIGDKPQAIKYADAYEVTVLYCKILPSEFALAVPNRNTPQVWKLILVNHTVIIQAQRLTNAHGYIPILIGEPLEDGLGYQTKSLAKNAVSFQQVASSFMTSIIHSRRRAISDRVLYDPSRVSKAHMNSDNPSAKIPVRPSVYGKNVGDAVYQFPFREDQAQFSMAQIKETIGLANNLAGQNPARQGQFVKGNKTRKEFDETMGNANGRDQTQSILTEAQVFAPLKKILKINVLQFEGGTTLYNRDKKVAVEVDPIALRKAVLEFKVSDGLVPADKLINADTFVQAIQVIGQSPQIGAAYNLAPMFSYLMKTQGAKIADFEKSPEQQAYEQALNAWQSAMQ
ncbi:MAG: hypothetical protein DRP42_05055, partial [Tenericutes bacterium]